MSIERCSLIKGVVIRDNRGVSRQHVVTNPGGQLAAGVPRPGLKIARRLPVAEHAQVRNAAA